MVGEPVLINCLDTANQVVVSSLLASETVGVAPALYRRHFVLSASKWKRYHPFLGSCTATTEPALGGTAGVAIRTSAAANPATAPTVKPRAAVTDVRKSSRRVPDTSRCVPDTSRCVSDI